MINPFSCNVTNIMTQIITILILNSRYVCQRNAEEGRTLNRLWHSMLEYISLDMTYYRNPILINFKTIHTPGV